MTVRPDRPASDKAGKMLQGLLAGAAVGAAAMFMLDPDRGRRRRKQAGQAMRRLGARADGWLAEGGRDAGNRWQGVLAQWRRLAGQGAAPTDAQLQARVRARLGRLVSHSHAVTVEAVQGCVTLGGPVLAHEKPALLADVARVAGVREVRDLLDAHDHADGIPALQGDGHAVRDARTRALPPAWRGVALASGGAMAWYALHKRSPLGLVLGTVGLALLARSAVAPRLRRRDGSATDMPREGDESPATQQGQILH